MINWDYYKIKIDLKAREKFKEYFNEIEKILFNQHLEEKKLDIFSELESHILDYISNKNISSINYEESMKIIAELGSPDEYADYSNIGNIQTEINKNISKRKPTFIPESNFIICNNCSMKNEESSIFCINCGIKLNLYEIDGNKRKRGEEIYDNGAIQFLFYTKRIYFLNLISVYLFLTGGLLSVYNSIDKLSILIQLIPVILILNELIIIPLFLLLELYKSNNTKYVIFLIFSSYLSKLIIFLTPYLILFLLFGSYDDPLFLLLLLFSYLTISILIIKFIFFSPFSKYFYSFGSLKMETKSKNLYFTVVLLCYIFILSSINLDLIFDSSTIFRNIVNFNLIMLLIFSFESIIIFVKFFNFKFKMEFTSLTLLNHLGSDSINNSREERNILISRLQINIYRFIVILILIIVIFTLTNSSITPIFTLVFILSYFIFISTSFIANIKNKDSGNIFFFSLGLIFFAVGIIENLHLRGVNSYLDYSSVLNDQSLYKVFLIISFIFVPGFSIYLLFNDLGKSINSYSSINNKIFDILIFIINIMLLVFLLLNLNENFKSIGGIIFFVLTSLILSIKPCINFINLIFSHNQPKISI
jgi:hypothetical protein